MIYEREKLLPWVCAFYTSYYYDGVCVIINSTAFTRFAGAASLLNIRKVRTGKLRWVWMILLLIPTQIFGQRRSCEVTIAGGAVHNFRTPLHIEQNKMSDIELDAKYRTEPFNPPVYYDVRVSTWEETRGWELKFTHHKLILDNLPPEVQRFSITDGFNLLTINRLWQERYFTWSVGAGIVITHPESTVRQKPYPENKGIFNKGYYISGPALEAALAKRYYFANRWFVLAESRITGAYVEVPVADGHARLTNIALHGLLGIGCKLGRKSQNVQE